MSRKSFIVGGRSRHHNVPGGTEWTNVTGNNALCKWSFYCCYFQLDQAGEGYMCKQPLSFFYSSASIKNFLILAKAYWMYQNGIQIARGKKPVQITWTQDCFTFLMLFHFLQSELPSFVLTKDNYVFIIWVF